MVLAHADGVTVGAPVTRRGWGGDGAVEVGRGRVNGVPTSLQGLAGCARSERDSLTRDWGVRHTVKRCAEDEVPKSEGDSGAL